MTWAYSLPFQKGGKEGVGTFLSQYHG